MQLELFDVVGVLNRKGRFFAFRDSVYVKRQRRIKNLGPIVDGVVPKAKVTGRVEYDLEEPCLFPYGARIGKSNAVELADPVPP